MKLAALDIGTNSFHLIVASISDNGNFEIIDREKEVIRLSAGNVGDVKIIQPDSIQRAIDAIKRFKEIADSHNAILRATATSAVRESLNKDEFLSEVLENTKVEIEVISGLEEARLIYLGVLKAIPVFNKKTLAVDIGGGSTEFIIGLKNKILYSNSLKLGAVRLTQRFFPDYILTDEKIEKAKTWVRGVIAPIQKRVLFENVTTFVGSSGTVLNIAFILKALRGESVKDNVIINNFEFSADELFEIEKIILSKKTPEERKKIRGLEEKRIDIIPAGVIILSTIFRMFNIEKMIVSDYALREGIIIDSMDKKGICNGNKKLYNIRFESIRQLADSSRYDSKHCYYVADLSVKLFDALKPLHNIDENGREYLEAASILHDIGYHISYSQHHRHSYYIVRNSSILGFNDTELEIIANIARYHRKSHPKKTHPGYSKLSSKNKTLVRTLASILRITDALDRTHSNRIENFKTIIDDNKITLELNVDKIPEVETWSLERRKSLFEEVFGRELIIKLSD